jgi:hypothetical protein
VGGQGAGNLLDYGFAEAVVSDADDRMQVVGGGAQLPTLYLSEFDHGGILT